MTFDLNFALFYAYTLALFAFIILWLAPALVRALIASARDRKGAGSSRPEARDLARERAVTRLEAFTRF